MPPLFDNTEPRPMAHPDPIRTWRENFARRVLNVDFEPLPDAPFRAQIRPIFTDLRMARTVMSPGMAYRDVELTKDGDDAFSLVVSQSRDLAITQQQRELKLGRGDATLMHNCLPGQLRSRLEVNLVPILIPNGELAERATGVRDRALECFSGKSESLRLLSAYISCLEKGRLGESESARATLREHIVDLVCLTIIPHADLGESGLSAVAAARLGAALDEVAKRFEEPGFNIVLLAQSQGVSVRYLQRLIETTGTSFTERLTELRLQRTLTLLTDPANSEQRVSDIALQAGFSDISHFNRLFRSRFGDTPTSIRGNAGQRPNRPRRIRRKAQPYGAPPRQ